MEEKVEYILKIITEDGDSFRVRAEQYYRKRPELVNFVEDTFRGYRALADRYDHLSRELQSANRTIAIVFPERVQMSFDEDEFDDFASNLDEYENNVPKNSNVPVPLPMPPKQNHLPQMESVVQSMIKRKSKIPTIMMSKKGLVKIGIDKNSPKVSKSSGLSKEEALSEIDRLQKDILGFQTEKQFVKSSYENLLSKFREIENNIGEMHAQISNLQHEFVVGALKIRDQDAQTLMSSSALKMCKETLLKLNHKQTRFKTEANVEHNRVDEIRKKFEALIVHDKNNTNLKNLEQTIEHVKEKKEKIEENGGLIEQDHTQSPNIEKTNGNDEEGFVEMQTTIKFEQKEVENMKEENLGTSEEITISEVAEKIEQLVDKVITLETDLASQTALIVRLRFEIDELHEKFQRLEEENVYLVDKSNDMKMEIKKLEEELERVQTLDKRIKIQNAELETSFNKVGICLDNLSKDILVAKPDQELQEDDVISQAEKEKTQNFPKIEDNKNQGSDGDDVESRVKKPNKKDEDEDLAFTEIHVIRKDSYELESSLNKRNKKDKDEPLEFTESNVIRKDQDVDCHEDEPKWNLILSHDIEDRERMLLEEYTSTLRNYKEVKQKLKETEKRNRARSFKSVVQMKMLRNSNESKDAEIRSLNGKLNVLQSKIENPVDIVQLTQGLYLGDERIEKREALCMDDERLEVENEIDEATEREIKKASNAIDEGTHRIKELVETAYFELKKARELVNGGTERRKEPDESVEHEPMNGERQLESESTEFELNKDSNLVDEEIQRIKELEEITDDERIQRRKEKIDGVDEAHDVLEVEQEIRTEIEDLRKENLELWLRFSTSFHQINRFQDSFHDLQQEIKHVQDTKQEYGIGSKQRYNHHHHHNTSSYSFDIRPIYRHLRDMQTEVILWLEKSGILEDDLQHRLSSLSNIQNELSELTNDASESERVDAPLNNYQAAKFQGEVQNMKQENVKVLEELREACDRVRKLQFDIEKTLSKLDEEVGDMNKSNTSSKVPFRSILFRSKLRRKKHKQVLQPREDS